MTRVPLCVDSSDGISFRDNGLPHPLDGGAAVRPRHLKQGIEGVDTVYTLAVGLGRTTAGLGRTGDVFGGVASIQRLEPGSSPTSGTCFPCSGACEPLSVHKLFTYRRLGGLFCWWPLLWPGGSFPMWSTLRAFVLIHGCLRPQLHDAGLEKRCAVGRCLLSGGYFTSVHCLRGRGRHDGTVGCRGIPRKPTRLGWAGCLAPARPVVLPEESERRAAAWWNVSPASRTAG